MSLNNDFQVKKLQSILDSYKKLIDLKDERIEELNNEVKSHLSLINQLQNVSDENYKSRVAAIELNEKLLLLVGNFLHGSETLENRFSEFVDGLKSSELLKF